MSATVLVISCSDSGAILSRIQVVFPNDRRRGFQGNAYVIDRFAGLVAHGQAPYDGDIVLRTGEIDPAKGVAGEGQTSRRVDGRRFRRHGLGVHWIAWECRGAGLPSLSLCARKAMQEATRRRNRQLEPEQTLPRRASVRRCSSPDVFWRGIG